MKNYLPTILIVLFINQYSYSQNINLQGVMPTVSATLPITKKLDFNFTSFCVFNTFAEQVGKTEYPAQGRLLLIQPSLIYKFTPQLSLAASYAYVSPNPFTANAGRILCPWQQINYSAKVGSGKFWNRLRIEETFTQKSDYWIPLNRIRHQIGLSFPLQGKTLDANEFYVNVHHESFINVSGSFLKRWSENWDYAGIGYVLPNKSKVEVGYMRMAKVRNTQDDLLVYNSLQVSYLFNFSMDSLINWWYN
jgi:hypothetical protein